MPSETSATGAPRAFADAVAHLGASVPADFTIAHAACDAWADRAPERRAVLDATTGRWWSYSDLQERSRRLAHAFVGRYGVRPGDRVAILLPQSGEAAAAHLAVYRSGAIAVPLSGLYGSEALSHRLGDSTPTVGVTDLAGLAALEDAGLNAALPWLLVVDHVVTGHHTVEEVVASAASAPIDEGGPHLPAMLIYTSGTTGQPKGALHAHRVVAAHRAPIHLAHDGFPQDGDVFWSPADWAWAGGLVDGLLASLAAGVPVVAYRGRRFEPDEVVDLLARHRVRNSFLPPTALRMLLRDRDTPLPGGLRSIMTGGEPVDPELAERSRQVLGATPNAVFGQTEASCVLGNSHRLVEQKAGALGVPYPGYLVRLVDADGAPVPEGETGELQVRADGAGVFLGYWRRDAATAQKVRDGWLRTGDLARRDADGHYWFVSRDDDIILSSGFRIGPAEIETCAGQVPGVAAAAAVGVPDPTRGEAVRLYVELIDGAVASSNLADEIRATIRARLAPYEVPRDVEFVDALPRTTTGKIARARLRAAEQEEKEAQGAFQ